MRNLILLIFLLIIGNANSQSISLDTSFGDGGYSNFTVQNINKLSNTIRLPNDDYITGYAGTTSSDDYIYLKKTSTNGVVDNSYFGTFHLPGVIKFKKLVMTGNKIIVLGAYAASYPYNINDILVVRFNLDGTIDSTFGNNGYELFRYDNTSSDEPMEILIDDSGHYIIYSSYGPNTSSGSPNYYLIKVDSTGTVDNSFGSNGRLYLYYYNQYDSNSVKYLSKIFLQDDGKFLLAGRKKNTSTDNWESYMERILQDGSYDTSFGNNGVIVFPNSEYSTIKDCEYNYDDNDILVLHEVDNINNSMERVFLSKIQISDGDLISNFANNGTTTQYMFSNAPRLALEHIKTLSDSKILVVGSVSNFSANPSINMQLFVMRFNSDGTIDNTSSNSGYDIFNTTPPNSSMRADYVNNLIDLNNGSFIIAYSGYSATSGAFSYLAKFNGATLGLDTAIHDDTYIVFPNPTKNHITVTRKDNTDTYFNFKIVDLTGKVLKRGKSKFNQKIQMDELSNGCYIFYAAVEKGYNFSKKILFDR